jgi:hypothetical protein
MSHGDDEDEVQQGLMMMPEIDELEQQQHEALSNDEAHDQLMELPYGGGLSRAVVADVTYGASSYNLCMVSVLVVVGRPWHAEAAQNCYALIFNASPELSW